MPRGARPIRGPIRGREAAGLQATCPNLLLLLAKSHFDLAGTRTRSLRSCTGQPHSLAGLVEHLGAGTLADFHRQGVVLRQLADKLYSILHRKDRGGSFITVL